MEEVQGMDWEWGFDTLQGITVLEPMPITSEDRFLDPVFIVCNCNLCGTQIEREIYVLWQYFNDKQDLQMQAVVGMSMRRFRGLPEIHAFLCSFLTNLCN